MTATLMEAQSLQAVPVAPSPALESLTQDSDEEAAKKPKRRSVGSAKAKPAPRGKSQPTKKGQKEKQELAKNLDVAEEVPGFFAGVKVPHIVEIRDSRA